MAGTGGVGACVFEGEVRFVLGGVVISLRGEFCIMGVIRSRLISIAHAHTTDPPPVRPRAPGARNFPDPVRSVHLLTDP